MWPVDSPHKGPIMWEVFSCHDIIMVKPIFPSSLRPGQNGRHFADDIFKRIFFNENVWISIKISLKFVPKGPINKIPALFQIMAWRRPGDKPLSEPMMISIYASPGLNVVMPSWWNQFSHHRSHTIDPSLTGHTGVGHTVNYSVTGTWSIPHCWIHNDGLRHWGQDKMVNTL